MGQKTGLIRPLSRLEKRRPTILLSAAHRRGRCLAMLSVASERVTPSPCSTMDPLHSARCVGVCAAFSASGMRTAGHYPLKAYLLRMWGPSWRQVVGGQAQQARPRTGSLTCLQARGLPRRKWHSRGTPEALQGAQCTNCQG